MSEIDPSFGPLTLSDLANRADVAWTHHMETYTAGTVLHRLHLAVRTAAETAADLELLESIDMVQDRLAQYRKISRDVWKETYLTWADAAGIEVSLDHFGFEE